MKKLKKIGGKFRSKLTHEILQFTSQQQAEMSNLSNEEKSRIEQERKERKRLEDEYINSIMKKVDLIVPTSPRNAPVSGSVKTYFFSFFFVPNCHYSIVNLILLFFSLYLADLIVPTSKRSCLWVRENKVFFSFAIVISQFYQLSVLVSIITFINVFFLFISLIFFIF